MFESIIAVVGAETTLEEMESSGTKGSTIGVGVLRADTTGRAVSCPNSIPLPHASLCVVRCFDWFRSDRLSDRLQERYGTRMRRRKSGPMGLCRGRSSSVLLRRRRAWRGTAEPISLSRFQLRITLLGLPLVCYLT